MNVATDPTTLDPQTAPPPSLYPAPPMVPVDFTRLDPLPPPPTKENTALIRFGTADGRAGERGARHLALRRAVVLRARDRRRAADRARARARARHGGGSTGNQTSFNGFAPRIVQRDIHDFGIVGWASSRREKRAVAIVAFALLTQAAVLHGLNNYRWRLFLALAGCGALATLALALIDLQRLSDLIRARIALATTPASNTVINASVLKIAGARPGSGMVILLVGAGCVLAGTLIALIGGRRGKVLAPIAQ